MSEITLIEDVTQREQNYKCLLLIIIESIDDRSRSRFLLFFYAPTLLIVAISFSDVSYTSHCRNFVVI